MSSPASTLPGGSTTGSESEKDSIQSENNKTTPSGTGVGPGVLFGSQFQQSPSKENDQPLLKQVHHHDSLENIAEKGPDLPPMTSAAEAILTGSQWEILLPSSNVQIFTIGYYIFKRL